MADEPTTDSRELAPTRPNRPTIIVQSPAAIFDSGKFEHLYRVATVMAKAGLMPDSLTTVKIRSERGADQVIDLPQDVVIARAFLIASQADRWNMDPLGLMNCCYLAHNKLGYEGKAVHAAIQSVVGIGLDYDFGAYDPKSMRVLINTPPPQPELLGVVVSGKFPDGSIKTIEGYVGSWKYDFVGKELPAWKSPGSWQRMLRYRGAREWCNAHTPHVTLGVLTEDDFHSPESPQIQFMDAAAPPPPRQLNEAFGRQQIPAGAAPAKAPDKPKPETVKGKAQTDKPAGEGKSAPAAAPDKATPGSATDASKDSPATSGSGQQPQSEPTGDGSKEEALRAGTQEHLDDAQRGMAAAGFIDPDTGEIYPTMQARLEAEETKKAAKSTGNVVELQTRTSPAGEPEEADREPGADEDADVDIAEFNAFASDVQATSTWPDFKGVVVAFRDGPAFAAAPADLRQQAMALAFDHATEKAFGFPAPEADVTWFRLWLWTITEETRGHARPAFRKLMRGGQFLGLPEAERNLIVDETTAASGE